MAYSTAEADMYRRTCRHGGLTASEPPPRFMVCSKWGGSMFKLAERHAATEGVFCGEDGVWLGPAPLIERSGAGGYRVRSGDQIEALLGAAYAEPPEAAGCIGGLHRVAAYLAEGNLPLAMIAAVRLRLGEIAEDRIERLARADFLLKANFNPDEPRDDRGRWTDDVAGDFILDDPGEEGSAGSPRRRGGRPSRPARLGALP